MFLQALQLSLHPLAAGKKGRKEKKRTTHGKGVDLQLEDQKEQVGDRFSWRTLFIRLINLDLSLDLPFSPNVTLDGVQPIVKAMWLLIASTE